MSGAVLPALVAAGGGSVLLGGIYAYEQRRDEAMRSSRVRLGLRFPAGLEPLRAVAALDSLSGLPISSELVLELAASASGIHHAMLVPERDRSAATAALSGAMPSLRLTQAKEPPSKGVTLALRLFVPTPVAIGTGHAAEASRGLLSGLSVLSEDEQVVLRWALRPGPPRGWELPAEADDQMKAVERAWRRKLGGSGFSVAGLLLVRADSVARARQLASQAETLVRSRRGEIDQVRITTERGNRTVRSLPRVTRTSGWLSGPELLPLLGWPLGAGLVPGVGVGGRQLPVGRDVPRVGYRLLVGREAGSGRERPVALEVGAASRHLAVLGKTGAGKSALEGNLVLSALAAGYGGVLIDPKDLVPELLARVPARDAPRVIPLELSSKGPAIGLDLFGSGDSYLRSDVILHVVRSISDGWGPRIDQHLRMGLQTVAALTRPALSDWLALYRDPRLRRNALLRVNDPFLIAEWRAFESLSAAEQFQHTAPAISRITNLLSRPALRAVLSQREPKLNLARVLEEGRWLFVSLNPGVIGEPAARLLGAIVLFLTWSAIEARVAVRAAERRPIMLALDELQSLASLPVGLEAFFERARSMNCSVVAATQTTARLPESLRTALLGNAGSLVTFRAGAEEAARLSRELPGLDPGDLMALGQFEVAARVALTGQGTSSATVTGRTEPLPPLSGQAAAIRARALAEFGRKRREIELDLTPSQRPASTEGPQIGSSGRSA